MANSVKEANLEECLTLVYKYTGSPLAKKMLDNWEQYVGEFIQVTPIEYRRILQEEKMKALQQKIDNVQRDY